MENKKDAFEEWSGSCSQCFVAIDNTDEAIKKANEDTYGCDFFIIDYRDIDNLRSGKLLSADDGEYTTIIKYDGRLEAEKGDLRYFNVFVRSTLFDEEEFVFSYDDHDYTTFNKINKSTADGIKYLINENKELKMKLELLEGEDE